MAITREEVLHVAALAKLALTEDEIERLQGQLSAILEAVGKVSELDLADVEPTSHPLDVVNVWADPTQTVLNRLAAATQLDTIWQTESGTGAWVPEVRVGGDITFLTNGSTFSVTISSTGQTFTSCGPRSSGSADRSPARIRSSM